MINIPKEMDILLQPWTNIIFCRSHYTICESFFVRWRPRPFGPLPKRKKDDKMEEPCGLPKDILGLPCKADDVTSATMLKMKGTFSDARPKSRAESRLNGSIPASFHFVVFGYSCSESSNLFLATVKLVHLNVRLTGQTIMLVSNSGWPVWYFSYQICRFWYFLKAFGT